MFQEQTRKKITNNQKKRKEKHKRLRNIPSTVNVISRSTVFPIPLYATQT